MIIIIDNRLKMESVSILAIGLSVILLGVSKAGFGGVGTAAALPVMSLGLETEIALGVLLPLLLATDVVSVVAHRKSMDLRVIFFALPGALLGVLVGAVFVDQLPPEVIAASIGTLAILFAVLALSDRSPDVSGWPAWVGSIFGAVSGFTSTVAHAGGPPIHIFFLAKAYAPQVFVATSAGFMAGVNILKIAPYFAIGAMDHKTLTLAASLAPLAVVAALAGVKLARVISKRVFKISVNWLLILAGSKLLYDAVF